MLSQPTFMKDAPLPENAPLLTGEDLFAMGEIEWTELVEGRLIRMSPSGYAHGRIECKLGTMLHQFVVQHQLGQVLVGEVGSIPVAIQTPCAGQMSPTFRTNVSRKSHPEVISTLRQN